MRVRSLLVVAAAAAAMVLVSCHHTTPSILVTVDDTCVAKSGGAAANPLQAEVGDLVCWENTTTDEIVIIAFDSRELFGVDSIRLNPGEKRCVRVRRGAEDHEFEYGVCCKTPSTPCRSGGVGGPKIKIGC